MNVRIRPTDEGMVTAEAAAVIPSLLLVLAIAIAALTAVHAQMRAVDASREAARLASRGESTRTAVLAAERLGPAGAHVEVRDHLGEVEAVVTAEVRPFPKLPGFTVRSSTTAEKESAGTSRAGGGSSWSSPSSTKRSTTTTRTRSRSRKGKR